MLTDTGLHRHRRGTKSIGWVQRGGHKVTDMMRADLPGTLGDALCHTTPYADSDVSMQRVPPRREEHMYILTTLVIRCTPSMT